MNYKEISDSLRKDMSPQEFYETWNNITSFLKKEKELVSVLEGIAYFDEEFVLENILFLADIFELAEDMSHVLQNDLLSMREKNGMFNQAFEEIFFEGLDAETIKILRVIFDVEEIN